MPAGTGAELDTVRIRGAISERGIPVRDVAVVAETGSTNADLVGRMARGEDGAGTVLLAERQTAGRGRNGRAWTSIPGAQVLMSVGVSVDGLPPAAWGWVPLLAGLAVADAAAAAGASVGLKWPNDVLAQPPARGKLAGILAEVGTPQPVVVVGIGINVNATPESLPDIGATSIAFLGGRRTDRERIVIDVLESLTRRVGELRANGAADRSLVDEYVARSLTIGLRVRAELPGDRQLVGIARDIDEQGRLLIEADGRWVAISAGDIVHLRPAE